jgi:hypothetical protein
MFKSIFSTIYKAWAKMLKLNMLPRAIFSLAFLLLTITMIVLALFGATVLGVIALR